MWGDARAAVRSRWGRAPRRQREAQLPTARPLRESFLTGFMGSMPVLPPGTVLGTCSSGQHSSAVVCRKAVKGLVLQPGGVVQPLRCSVCSASKAAHLVQADPKAGVEG